MAALISCSDTSIVANGLRKQHPSFKDDSVAWALLRWEVA